MLAALLAVLFLGVGSAQAQSTPVTTCGQTLSTPGEYHLTGNLGPCTGDGVVIAASDVHFTLAGFTISGVSSGTPNTPSTCNLAAPQLGISVAGPVSGVRINGGTVRGFVDGIFVAFGSNSRVHAMTVTDNCVFGIAAGNSEHVQLDTNVVTASGLDGVGIQASHDILVDSNDISGNRRVGVALSNLASGNTIRSNILKNNGVVIGDGGGIGVFNGDNNTIHDNAVHGNFGGIFLSGIITGTTIRDNTVNGNVNAGITINAGSAANTVRRNTARGNGVSDLSDGNAGCGSNSWKSNIFGTDLVAGVSDGGPGTGCIR